MYKRTIVLAVAGLLALAGAAQAQYKIIGPDGRVTYSDTPPPTSNARIERRDFAAPAAPSGSSPQLQAAMARAPVVLYTSDKCDPCSAARALFANRGVPFSERAVKTEEDLKLFRGISPDAIVPVVTIGTRKLIGYEPGGWTEALDSAGYPSTPQRSAAVAAPTPQSLSAPPERAGNTPAEAPAAPIPSDVPPPVNAPPGFRF